MSGNNLCVSRCVTNTLVAAGLVLGLLAGATAFAPKALAQNQDMLKLRDQLRDCRGNSCVPVRDQMMTQLRSQLQNCAGGQCEQIETQLALHERVRACHASGARGCGELRMQEREQVRRGFTYGGGPGRGQGQGRGQGMGQGQGQGMGQGMGQGKKKRMGN